MKTACVIPLFLMFVACSLPHIHAPRNLSPQRLDAECEHMSDSEVVWEALHLWVQIHHLEDQVRSLADSSPMLGPLSRENIDAKLNELRGDSRGIVVEQIGSYRAVAGRLRAELRELVKGRKRSMDRHSPKTPSDDN